MFTKYKKLFKGESRSVEVDMSDESYIVLMETQCYDKDNQLIYEGDVLEFKGSLKHDFYYIKYNLYTGTFGLCSKDGSYHDMSIAHFGKVVGNRYENKKLWDKVSNTIT